jgi:hypothetical protein
MINWRSTFPRLFVRILSIASIGAIVAGCATRLATRSFQNPPAKNPATACYIQGTNGTTHLPYSCSFVEFDERGDYIDFNQHEDMLHKIKEITHQESNPLLLVIYCHGWLNDSQSGDVVKFVDFLGRLAGSKEAQTHHLRVHGLYLSWRGNLFSPYVDKNSDAYRQTARDFGAPIVSDKYFRDSAAIEDIMAIPEDISYWSRKGLAESKVSGVPLARTVFEAANLAKQGYTGKFVDDLGIPWTNRVFVIGHSFCALMLEKCLGQANLSELSENWDWKDWGTTNTNHIVTRTFPIDCLLFINSAAPSIYAKELSDFMWADQGAERSYAPLIISITSSADTATRYAHRIANAFAPLYPSLQRHYPGGGLLSNAPPCLSIPQSYFYERTPGHNPLLVDHWIVNVTNSASSAPANDFQSVFDADLDPRTKDPNIFYTSTTNTIVTWNIGRVPDATDCWSYKGHHLVKRGNYWIISCNGDLIASHTAIWTTNTMELYGALYRLTYATNAPY